MRPRAWFVVLSVFVLTIGSRTASLTGAATLPAGTILNVRTTQPLDADSAHVGMKVTALVDDPVEVGGQIVVPRGTPTTLEVVAVEQSSNMKGRDRITLKMYSLHVGERSYPVGTSYVELKGPSEGKKAARKIVGGAGIGAAVGGIFGGGTGAAIGAATGGGTAAAITGSGKTHLNVPAETRLQFRLNTATRIG
jgi:hypothetical protein